MSDESAKKLVGNAFLSTYGETLIDLGYNIIPIPFASKSPNRPGWQKTQATRRLLKEWLHEQQDKSNFGIGILTAATPAVDIDVLDDEIADELEDWMRKDLKITAPRRVGRAPKRLFLFRTNKPFSKMLSGKFEDEWGDIHRVEILGAGQQFVAYGIHQGTKKPYAWSEDQPINIEADALPLLTEDLAKRIIEKFNELATAAGWKRKSNAVLGKTKLSDIDDDDPFADAETTIDISDEDLKARLMLVPDVDDYDVWLNVGMALFHQYNGEETGRELWHEWSETGDTYEPVVLDDKWATFNIEGKGRAPVTARYIIKMAKEAAQEAAAKQVLDLKDRFLSVKDHADWTRAAQEVKKIELSNIDRATLAEVARKKLKEVTDILLPPAEIRKALSYQVSLSKHAPHWLRGWVFDSSVDKFFHTDAKISMTMTGFNAVYARHALTKADVLEGRTVPKTAPAEIALNVHKIETVHGLLYMPGEDPVFMYNGVKVGNTYRDTDLPELPEKYRPVDKLAIKRIKAHIAHLLPDEREQKILLYWLAWVVQNPGKRVNWGVLLQGVQGDGKSFFAFLLRTVMGANNVRMMSAHVLEGSFTGWAHGQCVAVIEEPRLHGHNKYDIINRVKPFITNSVVEIHPKGKEPYNVPNTTNYFLPTNFKDALPLDDNDRRYCVLFSQWQSRSALRDFCEENPDYYAELYLTLDECAAALRKWLLGIEIEDWFPAGSDAPLTEARKMLIEETKTDYQKEIERLLVENETAEVGPDVITSNGVNEKFADFDSDLPSPAVMARAYDNLGYLQLGRFRVNGEMTRVYAKDAERFKNLTENEKVAIVRQIVAKRQEIIDENDDL